MLKFVDHKIINKDDVKDLEKQLKDHQKAISAEGMTVLEKALIEHNMSAISNIYMNISFEQLGRFLGITPEKGETIISKMISENRIKAILD